jgi:branched-chain amino acid aminotransferase
MLSEVLQADEVFLTATNKYIVPVVQIDGATIGDGRPGEQTKKLMQAMQEFVEKY